MHESVRGVVFLCKSLVLACGYIGVRVLLCERIRSLGLCVCVCVRLVGALWLLIANGKRLIRRVRHRWPGVPRSFPNRLSRPRVFIGH